MEHEPTGTGKLLSEADKPRLPYTLHHRLSLMREVILDDRNLLLEPGLSGRLAIEFVTCGEQEEQSV
jgi:hypothetical protein